MGEVLIILMLWISSIILWDSYKKYKSRNALFFSIMLGIAFLVNLIMLLKYA